MKFPRLTAKRLLIGMCIALVLVLLLSYLNKARNKNPQTVLSLLPTPTPVPIQFNKTTYTDDQQHYTIDYPQEWTKVENDNPADPSTSITFTENNIPYTLSILPPIGNTVPDVTLLGSDSIHQSIVYYGGKQYIKSTYFSHGKPIFLYATPNDPNFSFYSFSLRLPPTNTQKYMQLFDQILTNMQIKKDFNPADLVPPNPSQ